MRSENATIIFVSSDLFFNIREMELTEHGLYNEFGESHKLNGVIVYCVNFIVSGYCILLGDTVLVNTWDFSDTALKNAIDVQQAGLDKEEHF